ncbi:hypothetical protein ACFQ69_02565 [Streptomyces sp. NPDC056470]|uniref:hypothetical protein n=1 Tax=Streptomyces sp. NPDC056470 TaxID=3345831 RepID=UPI00369D7B23
MPPYLPPGAIRRAVSSLDLRIEAATGHDVDTLWAHRERGILDERHTALVDRHRALVKAETAVSFHRTLLHRLSSGEFPVDAALLQRIDRTVGQLEEAADERAVAARLVLADLEPIESSVRTAQPAAGEPMPAADYAALLAIAGGAKLHEHLLTGRMSVATASGTRIPYAQLQRLESLGLVSRDTSRPVHTGQPVALTAPGRAALASSHRSSAAAASPAPRPGTWPSAAHSRR